MSATASTASTSKKAKEKSENLHENTSPSFKNRRGQA
jgi:hypothetical protein